MKKAIILGAMAFLAFNIAGIQNAHAQVNKQREQMLLNANDTSAPSDQAKQNTKVTKVQKVNTVSKQREQMIQSANEADKQIDQVKQEVIIVKMPDMIDQIGFHQDSLAPKDMRSAEQTSKSLKNKKIVFKPGKKNQTTNNP